MALNRMPLSDYDRVMKLLSLMDTSKPVALVTISQQTGIKLADIIRDCSQLEAMGVLCQLRESGNIFYRLLMDDYEKIIDEKYHHKEPAEATKTPIDSREAILLRRRSMRKAAAERENNENNNDDKDETDTHNSRFGHNISVASSPGHRFQNSFGIRRQNNSGNSTIEPISAVDLLSIRRPTASPLGGGRLARISSVGTGSYASRDTRSSSTHKAVVPRSVFPTGTGDALGLERSDTNFKQIRPDEHQAALFSIIPNSISSRSNHEVSEQEVLEKLEITKDTPLLTVLSSRVTPEIWTACSALVNAGGGILILGMRKYIQAGEVTYFVKTVNNPEDAIKRLMNGFSERSVISDSPKDDSFISVVEFGRKKVLVLRLSPALFTTLPLYLARDSFSHHPNQGCFIYEKGSARRCTEQETKLLWEKFRLDGDLPDWDQTGEIAPIQMERKIKVSLPPLIDDAVRPLSRKESTFGMPVSQDDIRFSRRYQPGAEPVVREHREPPVPVVSQTARSTTSSASSQDMSREALAATGKSESPRTNAKYTEAADRNTLQYLLFAEDIRANSPARGQEPYGHVLSAEPVKRAETSSTVAASPSRSAAPQPETSAIPPELAQADSKLSALIDTIVEPAVSHPRLPAARLCEIAASLLKEVRLTPNELSELLNRKLPVIRTKIFPQLKETYKLHLVENKYYICK